MKTTVLAWLGLVALLASACGSPPREEPAAPPVPASSPVVEEIPGRWTFEGDAEGAAPAGFTFGLGGAGRPGSWVVRAEAGAPSGGRVLVQVDTDPTDLRFPVALAAGPGARDLRLSVKFRTVSGVVDRAAGLVFRAKDERTYHLVRANALEGNVVLFRVTNGIRDTLRTVNEPVPDGAWTELALEAAGDGIAVFLGGKEILRTRDSTLGLAGAGRVGVWTKSDSVTLFDDLVLEPR